MITILNKWVESRKVGKALEKNLANPQNYDTELLQILQTGCISKFNIAHPSKQHHALDHWFLFILEVKYCFSLPRD